MRSTLMAAVAAAFLAVVAAVLVAPAVSGQAEEKTLVSGWYKDRAVKYYDFGANTPLASGNTVQTAPIYVFIHGMNADGSPDFVAGQHNVVDDVPGDDGYSDLWQVMLVTVPDGYEPDSITSKDEIDAAGYEITETDMFVNCPIVPEGTTLEDGKPLVQGWNKGEEVFYPDFGQNSPTAIPIWVFIHGMNPDGTPDFVEGQQNIIDSVPGDPGYSAFWRVNMVTAPQDYVPNSIRSAADVLASDFPITQTDMVVNCPVTEVASAVAAPAPMTDAVPVAAPNAGTGPSGSSNAGMYGVLAGLLLAGAMTSGAAFALARRRAA
ncbi:MAG: hypothetical protein WEC75_12840 [Dehalococcoidia bacterium]